jgi:hypothetical protein
MSRFHSRPIAAVLAGVATLGVAAGVAARGTTATHKAAVPSPAPAAQVKVAAQDFGFSGIPATVKAGSSNWTLTNDGKQPHELDLIAVDPGHTLADVQAALAGSGPPS